MFTPSSVDRVFVYHPLNSAACWADLLRSIVIQKGDEICTPGLSIPPIRFQQCKEGYNLLLDLFKIDWIVRVDDTKVSLPVISNDLMTGKEHGFPPFWKQIWFG